ncbi:MAG TPA: hypothetical protein VH599_21870 [Ktedonobacterales bacterium]
MVINPRYRYRDGAEAKWTRLQHHAHIQSLIGGVLQRVDRGRGAMQSSAARLRQPATRKRKATRSIATKTLQETIGGSVIRFCPDSSKSPIA